MLFLSSLGVLRIVIYNYANLTGNTCYFGCYLTMTWGARGMMESEVTRQRRTEQLLDSCFSGLHAGTIQSDSPAL
jgi:hypothetical protein